MHFISSDGYDVNPSIDFVSKDRTNDLRGKKIKTDGSPFFGLTWRGLEGGEEVTVLRLPVKMMKLG